MARVLVIDREAEGRSGLRRTLAAAGHATVEARSCAEGLEIHARERVDLIVVELVLPMQHALEGIAVFHRDHPSTPVLMITGVGEQWWPTRTTAEHAGLTRLLARPYTEGEFLRIVGELLGSNAAV